jgi:flagellar basal-body rod protein FlgG
MNKQLLLIAPLVLATIAAALQSGIGDALGALQVTGRELDVAIDGPGYFQVTHPSGEILYTRTGRWAVNENQQLVLSGVDTELLLEPTISIPSDALKVFVDRDGSITVQLAGWPQLQHSVGRIQLARFEKPKRLQERGRDLYACLATEGPVTFEAEAGGVAEIRQFMLNAESIGGRQ